MCYRQHNGYSRPDAVEYAKKYALSPNPKYKYFPLIDDNGGDCANFLSQCLKAGGAPMTYQGEHQWWYNAKPNDATWSIPWAVAHSLYWTLKINEESNFTGPKGKEVFDIGEMELGDLLFFSNNENKIFHSAIITGFFGNEPLISQHSFEALNIPYFKSWNAFRIHLLKISV